MAHILIVEDNQRTAEFVGQHLKGNGHQCSYERTGDRVLDALRAGGHDMLMLDIMLPGISGFEVCRRIRKDPELYTLPVLVLSAMASEEEVAHGLAQGADDFVAKPFDPHNLVQRVEGLLRARSNTNTTDPLTSLPSGDYTKRELQKRISAQEHFAVAYVDLPALREFAYRCGPKARTEAIQRLGQALKDVSGEMTMPGFFAGHMGGGHFVCLLPPDKAQAFCQQTHEHWRKNLEELYNAIGQQASYHEATQEKRTSNAPPLLETLFCITFRESRAFVTPQHMFEVLSQLRSKAQTSGETSGVLLDRRTEAQARQARQQPPGQPQQNS